MTPEMLESIRSWQQDAQARADQMPESFNKSGAGYFRIANDHCMALLDFVNELMAELCDDSLGTTFDEYLRRRRERGVPDEGIKALVKDRDDQRTLVAEAAELLGRMREAFAGNTRKQIEAWLEKVAK